MKSRRSLLSSEKSQVSPLRTRRDYNEDDELNKPQAWTDKKLKEKVEKMGERYDGFIRPFWQDEMYSVNNSLKPCLKTGSVLSVQARELGKIARKLLNRR